MGETRAEKDFERFQGKRVRVAGYDSVVVEDIYAYWQDVYDEDSSDAMILDPLDGSNAGIEYPAGEIESVTLLGV